MIGMAPTQPAGQARRPTRWTSKKVTVLVEGDSIGDCLDAGLNTELAAPLDERELIGGATGEPVEVHPNEDASIDP